MKVEAPFAHVAGLESQEIWPGVVARPVHGERTTFALIELAPGTPVPEHSHDNEQMGMIVAGTMSFTVAGETRDLGPGDTWCIRSHEPHSVRAGPKGAVLVEIFTPARDDWAAIERRSPSPPSWPG